MLSVNIGPFAVSSSVLAIMLAGLVAAGVGYLAGRTRQVSIGNTLSDMLIVGAVVARLTFVLIWFDSYRSNLWSVLDIRDGGFTLWTGVAAALLLALWRGWRQKTLRKPLLFGLLAGALVWGGLFAALRTTAQSALPILPLTTLDGAPTTLAALADGKPMVVNLWASWCPPCRREMPVLAAAQQRETGVRFVFVNQGEDAATAQRYINEAKITLNNVLLDPGTALGRKVGSGALPTTLFYDAKGQLVDNHLGELSTATLGNQLNQLRQP
jgi:thiol-disulfide isomerase/thioredoxin